MLEALIQPPLTYTLTILLSVDNMLFLQEILVMVGLLVIFGVAAEFIARGTEKMETLLGQGMAGGVILGFMSALPETIFVIVASLSGYYAVAVATALGGNVLLFTLGIGLIGVAYFSKWKTDVVLKEDYHVDIAFLILSTFALLLLLVYGKLDAVSGILLFLIYAVYIAYRYLQAHSRLMMHIGTRRGRIILFEGLVFMLIGVGMIALVSGYFIKDIINVAGILAIPAIWLALIIAPMAADLEELISAYKLSRRTPGGGSTAIVGFIGSKLENNTILVGIIGLLAVAPVYLGSVAPEFIAVMIINAIAISLLSRGRFTYPQGVALIAFYFAAIIGVLIL